MEHVFYNRTDAAEFVNGMLAISEPGSALTMTITLAKYEDYFAQIVIEGSSEDTDESLVASNFFATQVNT